MKKFWLAFVWATMAVAIFASVSLAGTTPLLDRILADPDEILRQADGTWAVWVFFSNKDLSGNELSAALADAERSLPERTLRRRAKMKPAGARLVDEGDLPLAADYLAAVGTTGAQLRIQSRWLNAASFDATREQITAIAALPFVDRVEAVAKFTRPELAVTDEEKAAAERARTAAEARTGDRWQLEYGASLATLEQINVPPLHDLGLSGEGVVIAMLDSGFHTTHVALQDIPVLAQWDFVSDDGVVAEEPGDPLYSARHGTQTLSQVMGYRSGELVGTAYGASALLARTEDYGDEYPQEEDFWVAGIEWAEVNGADVVSSSLGYFYWYEYADLDGDTAVTTVAADLAVEHGLCVFNSAGNERQNEDFPHITPPADGHYVLALAAVDLDGDIASFSSPGPTYDGRIKPDLSAQGVGNIVASYYDDTGYHGADGTSFACPLAAGVAALLLERVPSLTPFQISEALKMTADRAGNPDNDYGWGIIDAAAAAAYWGPTIVHTPLTDTEDLVGPYTVTATITARLILNPSSLFLYYRVDGGAWQQVPLNSVGGSEYTGDIPGQAAGGLVEYYLEATDTEGITIRSPLAAPAESYAFVVGADTQAPSLFHVSLPDQALMAWPPTVYAKASDNVGIDRVELVFAVNEGAPQGPYYLVETDGVYELIFPLPPGSVNIGDVITYEVTAWDLAGVPNSTVSGPHTFEVVESLGRLLVIDNLTDYVPGKSERGGDGGGEVSATSTSPTDIQTWLTAVGYEADLIGSTDVGPDTFAGYDALVLSAGNNLFPAGSPILRELLINWVNDGGRILVEGGEIAEAALETPGFPDDFAEVVLHAAEWWGDAGGDMFPAEGYENHPYLNRPNVLPDVVPREYIGYDFGGGDIVVPTDDAVPILRTLYNPNTAGVIIYDDNTGVDAGQIVYLTFDLAYVDEATGRALVENAMTYLFFREPPGPSSISGTATLDDSGDASGVLVSVNSGQSAVTGPDGTYTIDGLWGSTYTVTASREGYAPVQRIVPLAEGEAATGVDFHLYPIVEVNATVEPDLPIPDNSAEGVDSIIAVAEVGRVFGVTVDINISHNSIGQLTVTLTSPEGTTVTLHNRTGSITDDIVGNWPETLSVDGPGSLDDFLGEAAEGDWILNVADHQTFVTGTLNAWGLNLLVGPDVVNAVEEELPTVTRLVGNAPNPFNPRTVISFELTREGPVQLDIFDLRGHRIRRLVAADLPAGRHDIPWDGRDGAGREIASGVYFARLQAGGTTDLHKLTMVR